MHNRRVTSTMARTTILYVLLCLTALCGLGHSSSQYGLYITYGTPNTMQARMNVDGASGVQNLGLSTGPPGPIVTYESATGPYPWQWAINTTVGGYAYPNLTFTDLSLLSSPSIITIDVCVSGKNTGSTRDARLHIVSPSINVLFSATTFATFNANVRRSICNQAITSTDLVSDGDVIYAEALSTATGGITLEGAAFTFRITTFPVVQASTVPATNRASYGTRDGMYLSGHQYPPVELGFSVNTGMSTYASFPGATPWTFTAVANTQAGGNYAWRLTITDETALASQFLEVDLTVAGGHTPTAKNDMFLFMSINGTGGDLASGRTWEYIDTGPLPTSVYVPFMIPNRYLKNGAILHIYGFTGSNASYQLNTARSLILTVNSRRNSV